MTPPVFTIENECQDCYKCVRHCPVKAITHDKAGCPVVDEAKCIGCGACEFFCPARPATAMQVEGV